MVSGRPLLYLSLPGVAFILGVFWFRRRNKNRPSSDTDTDANENKQTNKNENGEIMEKRQHQLNNSMPLKINGHIDIDDDAGVTKLFGKSAPIQIVQNGRGSPCNQNQANKQNLDSEILKAKIQDVEQKRLLSIDEDFENLSSSVDLPDSADNRASFIMRTVSCKKEAPVVIKATNTPKISPENSFLESKYTASTEQNNNIDEVKVPEPIEEKPLETNKIEDEKIPETTIVSETRCVENASPALSLCSESGDSGKGSSLPRSEPARGKITYEFFFPSVLIGFLYGKNHSFIKHLNDKTSAVVTLSKKRYAGKVHICKIEGTEKEVDAALNMIRQRLPLKRYPNFTMQRIYHAEPQTIVPLSNESLLSLQLNLIEGINNDVVVTSVINGAHIFVQHPLHPSHPTLALLQKFMYESYSNSEAPLLPNIEINAVCVLPVNGIWYRVQILEQDANDSQFCLVKFLDFGGYMYANFEDLRQIRSDFMGYPFQATECVLSNIEPIGTYWEPEAADILCELTKGIVLQAQVAGYNSQNVPEIYLFACLGPNNVIFINKELVARNLARWVEIAD